MNLLATLRIALKALRVNLLRSVLTMLGIIIGVAAVITMIAVGGGAQARIQDQIQSLGSNLMIIIPGSTTASGVRLGAGANQNLTEDDAIAIANEVPEVQVAAPSSRSSGQLIAANNNWATQIYGVTPDYLEARDWPLSTGRMFEPAEVAGAAKVVVIGQTVATQLFGDMDPLDQTIRVKNVPFSVIGVLATQRPEHDGHRPGRRHHGAAVDRAQPPVRQQPGQAAAGRHDPGQGASKAPACRTRKRKSAH